MIVLKDLDFAACYTIKHRLEIWDLEVTWPEPEKTVYVGNNVTQERRKASREARGSGTWYSDINLYSLPLCQSSSSPPTHKPSMKASHVSLLVSQR